MKKFLLTGLLFVAVHAMAQYPGGVHTNLTYWLKANAGITLNGTTVGNWAEQSGAGITGDFATSTANIGLGQTQNQPAYVTPGLNFNPHVVFSQTAVNSLTSANSFPGTSLIDPNNNTLIQVIYLQQSPTGSTGVFFKWQYLNTTPIRLGCETNPGGANTGKMRCDFKGLSHFSTTVITTGYFMTEHLMDPVNSTIRLNGANDNVAAFAAGSSFNPTQNARLTIGNEENGDAYPTSIDVAEELLYDRTLTAAELNKVESYLAVKYGFTLSQNATYANNYTSANGTVIWNHYDNLPFINNITGIGRDDSSALNQYQSLSINPGAFVTIFNGSYNGSNFPVNNTDNTNTYTANNSFLLFGDNGLDTALTRCFAGNPGFFRMNKAWKFEKTGTIGTTTLSVKTTMVPVATKHLLVSSDSAFTPANTTSYDLTSMNGYLSVPVALPDSGYFTFASDSLKASATSNSPLCSGSTLMLNGTTYQGSGYQWTGPNGFTSTVQNPTISNVSPVDSGNYILSGTLSGCPIYPDTVLVVVHNIPPAPVVVSPVTYCQGAQPSALTANGQNLAWYSTSNPAGTAVPPIPSTSTVGNTLYEVTQSIGTCISDTSKINVVVNLQPNNSILISDTSLCQFDSVKFTYAGNAPASATYNWTLPAGANIVNGSGQGPLTVQFSNYGTQQVTFNVTNLGCSSADTTINISVTQAPTATIVAKKDICIDEAVNISATNTTPDISNYNWNFPNGNVLSGSDAGPYSVSWDKAGQYSVSLYFLVGACPSQTVYDTITVHPFPDVRISIVSATTICIGDTIEFTAESGEPVYKYQWAPAAYFTSNGLGVESAAVPQSGYISVTATSNYGCVASDSVYITSQACCQVEVPSAFSPNGDGRNDAFRVLNDSHQKIISFRVTNRWGQVVYSSTSASPSWDGTFNGVPQDIGVYFYDINYACSNGTNFERKGDVTLIR